MPVRIWCGNLEMAREIGRKSPARTGRRVAGADFTSENESGYLRKPKWIGSQESFSTPSAGEAGGWKRTDGMAMMGS